MSLLDKMKGWSPERPASESAAGELALQGAGGTFAVVEERSSAQGPITQAMAPDSSIITESAPTEGPIEFAPPVAAAAAEGAVRERPALPWIGGLPIAEQQRILIGLAVTGLLGLLMMIVLSFNAAGRGAAQATAAGQALMQSQRLAKSTAQAVGGNASAFAEMRDAVGVLATSVNGLRTGENGLDAAPPRAQEAIEAVHPLVERAEKGAHTILAQQQVLTGADAALRAVGQRSPELLERAEAVLANRIQSGASAQEVAAAGQLVMLTQRIGKSASDFLASAGAAGTAGTEALAQLGRDVTAFQDAGKALQDSQPRAAFAGLMKSFGELREQLQANVLGKLPQLAAAREAQAAVMADSEGLRKGLEAVQSDLGRSGGLSTWTLLGLALFGGLLALGGAGVLRLQLSTEARRAALAEQQRLEAEREQREVKRVNDANQAAILRLMNELQTVAEGDLTQQATVTEDITGAIADSVNYTVEELRSLVAQVQGTVGRVTETTQQVEATSTELLAASTEQLREIRDTGESVLQMAGRINSVSAAADQTAEVARQSRVAAESGLQAVQNTIGGMNSMRDQIQETSKRIKRLGESSQEIGEITELISDITEQTNVLALNAAIQAASAGEAGRGFSVVAGEVQRLAERSGDATRQIAALVKTIQTDTQDAVAAMERSTQGVVESTRLSDAAGAALVDIDRVSRRLSELIGRISDEARREAESANVVATNIQHIFAVTEQTGEGTRSTAQMVRELSRNAEELAQSVARFKIS